VAIYTGCRAGELALLRSGDWFPADNRIRVRSPKTDGSGLSERYLEVHPELAKIFEKRRCEEFLFPELTGCHSENWCRRNMKSACTALGIQYRRFHGVRHTFATYLLDSGSSIMDTKEAMGHTAISTTAKYLRFVKKPGQVEKLPY